MIKQYSVAEVLSQSRGSVVDGLTVDCVVIAFHEGKLKILLNKFNIFDTWMLLGGFVGSDDDVDDAAYSILQNRIGMDEIYMKQFHLFGKPNRLGKEEKLKMLKSVGVNEVEDHWFLNRYISMGYYALVKYSDVVLTVDDTIEKVDWFDFNDLPPMYADHANIIEKAVKIMRMQVGLIPLGYELLPEKFTMPELRLVYEGILGEELDRRNFQRKVLSAGLINRLNEKRKNGPHKAPHLYSFNVEKYEAARDGGGHLLPWTH